MRKPRLHCVIPGHCAKNTSRYRRTYANVAVAKRHRPVWEDGPLEPGNGQSKPGWAVQLLLLIWNQHRARYDRTGIPVGCYEASGRWFILIHRWTAAPRVGGRLTLPSAWQWQGIVRNKNAAQLKASRSIHSRLRPSRWHDPRPRCVRTVMCNRCHMGDSANAQTRRATYRARMGWGGGSVNPPAAVRTLSVSVQGRTFWASSARGIGKLRGCWLWLDIISVTGSNAITQTKGQNGAIGGLFRSGPDETRVTRYRRRCFV